MESGVYLSLHPNCHHEVKLQNLICLFCIHHLTKELLGFNEKANPGLIRRVINKLDWTRALSNVSIDKKVCYSTETLLYIIHNFIPHERIVCNNRDPPWVNGKIKNLINEKTLAYKSYCRFNRDVFLFK